MNGPAVASPRSAAVRPSDHPPVVEPRIGVLLVNLGTPDATDYWSMRRYLKEFLSDRRVIDTPRLIWWPVLNLIILSVRPAVKGRLYAQIWNKERDESPLKTITRAQAEALATRAAAGALGADGDRIIVDWAMRYGNPSIASRLADLQSKGCDRILLVPLYPQYAAATTATVCDEAFRTLAKMRWQPALRVAPPWHDDPVYISAVANSIDAAIRKLDFEPEVIICSFHGVPKAYLLKGDPYHCQCAKTARLLREHMNLSPDRFMLTFQSRFGATEWLRPYTDETVKELARKGVKRIAIVTPGFVADCIETMEEIGIENAGYFRDNGGEKFARVDCLNAGEDGMRVIETVVKRELMGWS